MTLQKNQDFELWSSVPDSISFFALFFLCHQSSI